MTSAPVLPSTSTKSFPLNSGNGAVMDLTMNGHSVMGAASMSSDRLVLSSTGMTNSGLTKNIYLSAIPRGDGAPGSGSAVDPFDVSSIALFDAFWAGQFALNVPTNYYLSAGTYTTALGICPRSGWSISGSGANCTQINLRTSALSFGVGGLQTDNCGWGWAVICGYAGVIPWTGGNQQTLTSFSIRDITLDGGANYPISCPVTGSSGATPAIGSTFNVTLSNTSGLVVGSYYYLQDADDAYGTKFWYGAYILTALSGNTATLQNSSTLPYLENPNPVGLTVPTTASLYYYGTSAGQFRRIGIFLTGSNIVGRNLIIQNVCCPGYEGPVGIGIDNASQTTEFGNLFDHFIIRNVLGRYPTYLEPMCQGGGAVEGVYSQCDFTNGTIFGNGYYQGIGGWGYANCHFYNLKIMNVETGVWCDTNNPRNNRVRDCTFVMPTTGAVQGFALYISGAGTAPGYRDSIFEGNTIFINNPLTAAFALLYAASGNLFKNNRVIGAPFVAIRVTTPGVQGNRFIDNQIDAMTYPFSSGGGVTMESGTVDQYGNPVYTGLTPITKNLIGSVTFASGVASVTNANLKTTSVLLGWSVSGTPSNDSFAFVPRALAGSMTFKSLDPLNTDTINYVIAP